MNKFFKKAAAALIVAAALPLCSLTAMAEIEPNPVISRNVPVYSNSGQPSAANDEHYFSFCFVPTPGYVAYDLSGVPEEQRKQVLAVWYNTSAYDDIGMYRNRNMEPSDYTVEVNSAPGGEYPEDGWEVVETVSGNTLSSRQHLVSMEGYNWIRLNIAMANDSAGTQASFNFDVHTVSNGVSDSWLFLGDSITAGGMNNCYGTGFATHINMLDDRYFPVQENGGIGGIKSSDGKENIDRWLSTSQAKYVSIAYGTNDCWGNPNATEEYRANTEYMIDAVLAAGKTPVLPKIPASTNDDVMNNVPLYNAVIDEIYEKYGDKLVQGPDFQAMFGENPDYLSGDGVHPSDVGYAAMRETWAKTMYERVYTAESAPVTTAPVTTAETTATTTTVAPTAAADVVYGDANEDGIVDIADATMILQYIGNGDKYTLTEQGAKNADCCDPGSGITALDALTVQKLDAKVLTGLPELID
ncbi:MAG: GDSL-type esterase/lipase family protein [Alistipes sp.]|nr:GDSL-type esterase/lipase family protein [Alistipes sp.]